MALCLNKLAFLESMQNECLFGGTHQYDLNEHQALNVYWSQENRLERAYDRAFDRLRALQKERLRARVDPSAASITATLPLEELAS